MNSNSTPDYKALCAELANHLQGRKDLECGWPGEDPEQDLLDRARAALAQSEPVAPTVIGPEWQPCVKLPITVHVREQRPGETHSSTREGITPLRPDDLIMRGVRGEEYPIGRELFNQTYRMGAALAQPEPVAPTDEELDGVMFQAVWECMDNADDLTNDEMDRLKARAVLARWGRPAIEPVPVSERLPDPEDCDAEGRCWMFDDMLGLPSWTLIKVLGKNLEPDMTWLPHHALPMPAPANNTGGTH
jgi:hypothetical protein